MCTACACACGYVYAACVLHVRVHVHCVCACVFQLEDDPDTMAMLQFSNFCTACHLYEEESDTVHRRDDTELIE